MRFLKKRRSSIAHPLAGERGVEPLLGGRAVERRLEQARRPPPAARPARSASTKPRVTISGGDSRRPVWRSRTTIGHHDALGREVPPVAHHDVLDLRRRRPGRAARARRATRASLRAPAGPRRAARRRPRPAGRGRRGSPAAHGEARVLREHAVLAVDRARGSAAARGASSSTRSSWLPWPETWTRAVPRVHHVAAEAEQVADEARHRALVAGDGAGGEHDGVARARRERRGARPR